MATSKFIHFCYDRKMTKFDYFVLRDTMVTISQLHTMASYLLTIDSSERKFLSA